MSGPLSGKKLNSVENANVNLMSSFQNSVLHPSTSNDRELDSAVHKLWDLDTLGIKKEDEVHANLIDDIEFTGQRYSVKLPWKVGHKPLPSNYVSSLSRLSSQLKKLRQNPEILKEYDAIIKEQLEKGIIERVVEMEQPSKVHYFCYIKQLCERKLKQPKYVLCMMPHARMVKKVLLYMIACM